MTSNSPQLVTAVPEVQTSLIGKAISDGGTQFQISEVNRGLEEAGRRRAGLVAALRRRPQLVR